MPISIAGSGTITGISAGGLPDDCITTADIAAGAVTPAKTTGGPAFSAIGGAQTLTSGTQTKVICDTELFDTNASYDSSTGRFAPNVPGYYEFSTAIQYTGASYANIFTIKIYKNGSSYLEVSVFWGDQYTKSSSPLLMHFNGSTDYVEVYVAQFSGSNQTIGNCTFSAFLARPA